MCVCVVKFVFVVALLCVMYRVSCYIHDFFLCLQFANQILSFLVTPDKIKICAVSAHAKRWVS